MAVGLFKLRYLPNADGSDSTTLLTNANTVFVHTYLGDDSTGDGTREYPYKSISKANQKSGISYIVFRGVINEYIANPKPIIGDDKSQLMYLNYMLNSSNIYFYNLTFDQTPIYYNGTMNGIIYNNTNISASSFVLNHYYCLFKKKLAKMADDRRGGVYNSTMSNFALSTATVGNYQNNIIINNFDCYGGLIVKYFLFPTTCVFSYNGTNIVHPNYSENNSQNIELIRNSFIAAGMTYSNSLALFYQISNKETCKIIKQIKDGGTSVNVFNRYDVTLTGTLTSAITANQAKTSIQLNVANSSLFLSTGDVFIPNATSYTNNGVTITGGSEVFTYTSVTIDSPTLITFNGSSYTFKVAHSSGVTCTRYGDVLDYTLNPDIMNEALWASDSGKFVGCFKPQKPVDSINGFGLDSPINVNANGTDTVNSGTLLVKNANDSITFNIASGQVWNRIKGNATIPIPDGSNFKGIQSIDTDGSAYGTYLGKKQLLISGASYNAGDTLTVGTIYRVTNPIKTVDKGIIYNGITYPPDYFFRCVAGVTTFSLVTVGSGTVVKPLVSGALESVEIIPYDDLLTPSVTIPKFSCPLFGNVLMLYNKTSLYGTINTPAKFGDAHVIAVCGTRLPANYYDNWAITNADPEFVTLIADTTNYYAATPTIKYLRIEINGHYDINYGG